MNRLISFLVLAILLSACTRGKVFQERHDFKEIKWNRFEEVVFKADIQDTQSLYDVFIDLRHHTVFPHDQLKLTMAISSPGGQRRIRDISIQVKDGQGKFLSKGMGDLWDLEVLAFKGIQFDEPGIYTILLENRMSKYDTPGVMQIGISILKHEE